MEVSEDTYRLMIICAEIHKAAVIEYLEWHATEMTTEQIGQAYYILQRADEDLAHASEKLAALVRERTVGLIVKETMSEVLLQVKAE
jgi:hypothetical protein